MLQSSSVLSSSVLPPSRRTESPCDLGLTRMASSRERKRRSLILPSMSSNRQPSPARSAQPSSPLRMNKARPPSMCETLHSPIASPVLSTSDFSSPMVGAQQLHHHRSFALIISLKTWRLSNEDVLLNVSVQEGSTGTGLRQHFRSCLQTTERSDGACYRRRNELGSTTA